uniref:Ribosome-binding factor A n=1 Tax=Vitrella brassicaformis TaxID=1169539 RepID=A0A7S1P043_9ALVE
MRSSFIGLQLGIALLSTVLREALGRMLDAPRSFLWRDAFITAMPNGGRRSSKMNLLTRLNARGRGLLDPKRLQIMQGRLGRDIMDSLSDIFLRGGPSRAGFADEAVLSGTSIVDVTVARDLRHATVYVSIMGDTFDKRQGFAWLQRNVKGIRWAMAQRMRRRKAIPFLKFELVDVGAQVEMMNSVLEDIEEREGRGALSGEELVFDFSDDVDEETESGQQPVAESDAERYAEEDSLMVRERERRKDMRPMADAGYIEWWSLDELREAAAMADRQQQGGGRDTAAERHEASRKAQKGGDT